MILALATFAAAAAPAATGPVTISPALPPACQVAEYAMRDQLATMTVRAANNSHGPGPLGREYMEASDRLALAMRAEKPDFDRIGALWRKVNQLKIEIGQRLLVNKTECDLLQLKGMPLERQRAMLRNLSPMTQEERNRPGVAPVPPPRIMPKPANQ